jgi:hypothetical protein
LHFIIYVLEILYYSNWHTDWYARVCVSIGKISSFRYLLYLGKFLNLFLHQNKQVYQQTMTQIFRKHKTKKYYNVEWQFRLDFSLKHSEGKIIIVLVSFILLQWNTWGT